MPRLTYFLLMACLPALLVTANAAPVVNAKLGRVPLQLVAEMQTCQIKRADSLAPAQSLNLPWPCQFHLDQSGQPRIVRNGKFEYLLVEASTPLANSRDCDTHLRAVRAKGGHWQVSEYQDKVTACPPFQWDSAVFSGLFK
jgi:hypothetical protein